jgi:ADP-heptose:LPS heptosyltransferase
MPERSPFALRRDLLFLRTCGVSEIIGAGSEGLRLRVIDERTSEVERECSRLARSLSALGSIDLEAPENWDLSLTPSEHTRAREKLPDGPFLAVNMGGKLVCNDWGADRWLALLKALAGSHPSLGLVTVGGPGDRDRADLACRIWIGPTRNLCGALSVRETAAALTCAALFVGHDSGPMHLAAAVGVPIVALFGDNNPPKKWHPIGPYHICLHDMRGVGHIPVAETLACVNRQLTVAQPHARVRLNPRISRALKV